MNIEKFSHRLLRLIAVGTLIVLIAILLQGHRLPSASQAFDSPLPTPPFTLPAPTAVPIPRCHALAMAYVAREHDIPIEKLMAGSYVSNENGKWTGDGKEEWFEFPLIKQRACFVKVSVKGSDAVYGVALDEQGQVVDLDKLQALEREAGRAKCGKFDPTLCARLPMLALDEQVEVAIWLKDIDKGTIYDAVAANYPASLQPAKGLPFDTGHPDYQRAFQEVERLTVLAYREQVKPVLTFLEAQGFKAQYASSRAPIVFGKLPRSAIVALANRDDTVGIYLLGGELHDTLNSVVPTDRIAPFWNAGYQGNGIKVAIVEDDPVNFGNPYLDQANGGTCDPFPGDPDDRLHPTQTAGVVAMDGHNLYRGIAPGATLVSADAGSYSPQSKIATASDCVINSPYSVDVLNLSFQGDDLASDFWSRYFDHVVWSDRRTAIAVSGNDTVDVSHPGRGYNVLTVGGFDDSDNSNWSDDHISDFSNYRGPGSRDKPEVVAVAERICTTNLNDVDCTAVGTSFAAPQVSGLAALVMTRTGITRAPEVIKAIIMASAVHNIEGDSRLSDRDGVGGIDGALAYSIANHGRYGVAPQGWYDYQTVYYSSFDANGNLHYYVPISRGEKVRIVLAYDSHPNSTDPYNNDQLYSDLDLRVYRPSGSEIASSVSVVNSFEIIEFTADETGNYDVRVRRVSWSATYEYIGIAWVKDATYLPDLCGNKDGWVSEFYVRNDGPLYRHATIQYFDPNGNPTPKGSDICLGLAPNQWCWIPVSAGGRILSGTTGSAIVDGGEDVTVVVETQKNSKTERTNYSGILPSGGSGSPGWEQAGTALYAPVLKRQRYGRSSTINIFNAGAQIASEVHVDYFEDGGVTRSVIYYNVNPNSKLTISDVCTAAGRVCSAKIYSTNGQLLAGVVQEYNDADGLSAATYNLFSAGATPIYFPLAKFERYSMSTGLRIQNVGNTASTVNVYEQNGNFKCALPAASIPSLEARTFLMNSTCPGSNFSGSVVASADQSLIGMAHEVGTGTDRRAKGYSSFQGGSHTIIGPLVYHTYAQDGYTWDTGIAVQNLSDQATTVNLYYYESGGNPLASNPQSSPLAGRGMAVFFAPQANFKGSVVITAVQNIAAVINVTNNAPSGDTEAIYNASNR